MIQTEMKIGEIYHDRYKPTECLGGGGWGAVYKAEDLKAKQSGYQLVAIKHISSEAKYTKQEDRYSLRKQIEHEVGILKNNSRKLGFIPNYIDNWSAPLGEDILQHYIVMELISGNSLKGDEDREWSHDEMESFLVDMLSYLERLHAIELYHRDLKPENIIRRKIGRFCIVDFGFANQRTPTIIRGLTQRYASPEHYDAKATVAGPSDLYCLGATAYHLFSGKPPIPAHLRNKDDRLDFPVGARTLPNSIADTILEMLAFDLSQRPASAAEALQRLRARQAGDTIGELVGTNPLPPPPPVIDLDTPNGASDEGHKPTTVTDVASPWVNATLGHGRITGLSWAAESSTLLITTAIGVYHYQYRAGSFDAPRLLLNTPEPVLSAALSRDGQHITIAQVRWIERRSVQNAREIDRIPCDSVNTIIVSADGKMIAIVGDAGIALGPVTPEFINKPPLIATSDLDHVSLSSDGATIAALIDGRLRRWRLEESALVELGRLHGNPGTLRQAVLNLDGSLTATANESMVQLWDADGYEKKHLVSPARSIDRIALDRAGKQIAFAAQQKLHLRSFSDSSQQQSTAIPSDPLIDLSFSSDGTVLAAATSNCVWIWPFSRKEEPRVLWEDAAVELVAFSSDGKLLLTAGKALACYPVAEGRLGQEEILAPAVESPRGLAVHGNERKCLVALADLKQVQIWERAKRKNKGQDWSSLTLLKSSTEHTGSITFGAAGTQIVSITAEGVETWPIRTGLGARQLFPIPEPVYDTALSSNGQILAAYDGARIKILKTADGTWGLVQTIDTHIKNINTIALSSDGEFLAIGSDTGIRLLNSNTGDTLAEKEDDECGAKGLVFSPNTRVLAAISGSKLRLWGIEETHSLGLSKSHRASLRDIGSSQMHTECICDLAFAAKQTIFATASHDGTVRLWHYNDIVA